MLLLKSFNARVTLCPLSKWLRQKSLGEHFPRYKTNLPLTEECVLNHSQLVFEEDKLASPQRLRQHVCYLLISGNVLKHHCPSLNIVLDEMIPDLNVL